MSLSSNRAEDLLGEPCSGVSGPVARRASRPWGFLPVVARWSCVLLVTQGCTETVVEPVAVASVELTPRRFSATVSDRVPLSAEILDLDGNVLPNRSLSWASLDPGVATVSEDGIVTAVGPGQVLVTATAGNAVGTAQATIEARPKTRLAPGSLDLSGVESGEAVPATVRVSNEGGGTLDELSTQVVEGSGWLAASLSRNRAPATLELVARPQSLARGTYTGRVRVTSAHDSRTVSVRFEVAAKPKEDGPDPDDNDPDDSDDPSYDSAPRDPHKLEADENGEHRIDLKWVDRSDNETRFEIERRTPGGSWAEIATVDRDEESYRDRGLEEDTTYEYRVRACNPAGCSKYSKRARAKTDDD